MMKPHAFLVALCLAAPASGQTLLSDAFGVFDAETDAARAVWSGLVAPISTPGARPGEGTFVAPGSAETVLIHFGEKSLAQGSDVALIAALVLDRHGNLVADGTELSLVAADGAQTARVRYGIAARSVAAGEALGQHHAWAETAVQGASRQSPRVSYRVVPALSDQSGRLVAPTGPLRTEEVIPFDAMLADDAGMAELLDGMSAQIVLTHPFGAHSLVPAQLIGGRLHARLLTREISGPAEARLHLPFAASSRIAVDIAPIAAGGPLRVGATVLPDIAATRLSVGPLTTGAGHLLHDGSHLRVAVTDAAGGHFEAQAWSLDGVAQVTVPTVALPFAVEVVTPAARLSATVTRPEAVQ
jgi:hypothetical protein